MRASAPTVDRGRCSSFVFEDAPLWPGAFTPLLLAGASAALAVATRWAMLGALGCGAFRNDPDEVCAVFRELLQPGGEFGSTFSAVIFAVIKSGRNLRAFAQGGFPLLKVMSRRPDEVGAQISSLMQQAGGGAAAGVAVGPPRADHIASSHQSQAAACHR